MAEENQKLLEIKSILEYLTTIRNKFESRWQDVQRYVSPSVYDWNTLDSIPSVPKRYSSSPVNYRNTLISGLIGYSISPNIVWFKLGLENQNSLNLYGVRDWLEEVETVMIAEFNRSNLYQEAPKLIGSGVDIGHGVMLIDEDLSSGRLRFTNIRANEIYLDTNEYGEVKTVYRKYLMTIGQAVKFFGLENLSERVRDTYEDQKKRNENITILFAVYPRDVYNPALPDVLNMPYAAVYIELENNHIIKESGYTDFPYAIFEWEQIPGYAYSESPAAQALPDIKYLNTINDTAMRIAQTSAEPPLKASEDILDIDLSPKGVTYLPNGAILEPVKTGENYAVTLQVAEMVKQNVKDWFNVDFFLMLQSRQGKMTATEVMELQGEKAAVLSNIIVALNTTLSTIVQRSFNILLHSGKLPPPPTSLANGNESMKVDFIGPLAQAQKKYHELGGISTALQTAIPIMQMFPESGDFIDSDQLMKRSLMGNSMPQSVIREDDDVAAIREQRAQAQAEAQAQALQQQQQQTLMQNYDKLNQPTNTGSAIDAINQQLSGVMQ